MMSLIAFEAITYDELENTDVISVELVPERKGLILKHCEYYVSSRRHGTTVSRRYNDFVQLYDVLFAKYPYRAISPLPPKRVVVGGGSSSFLQHRRAGLQSWLCLVARHPVLAHDADVRAFLCEPAVRLEKPRHDEYAMAGSQDQLGNVSLEVLQERLATDQEQLKLARMGLERLHQIFDRVEGRCKAECEDIRELGAALTALASAGTRDPLRRAAFNNAAALATKSSDPPLESPCPLSLALQCVTSYRTVSGRAALLAAAPVPTPPPALARLKYCLAAVAQEANVSRAYLSAALDALPEQFQRHGAARGALAALWRDLAAAIHNR